MSDYTLEQGLGVRERMDLLAAVHGPATVAVLDRLGVPEGARCLDPGCGGGQAALELARRVGPNGVVVGIDLDGELLAVARDAAAARGWDHLTFRAARVADPNAYDRGHAALKDFTADPTTLISAPRVFHAWGTRV